jgi:S-DNA-T family DNA segregation ATPase FtsK/SpoIIIE
MWHRHRWRLDLAAGILFIACLFLALSVFSWAPGDLPGTVYPPPPRPHNLLGPAGAYLGQALLDSLGAAVHVLLGSWLVFLMALVRRDHWRTWARRWLGWLVLVPCVALLASWAGTHVWPATPATGSGGSIGGWLALVLQSHLQPAAQQVLAIAWLLTGLFLGLDFLMFPLLRQAWAGLRTALRGDAPLPQKKAPPVRPLRLHADDEADSEGEPDEKDTAADEAGGEPWTIPIRHHDVAPLNRPHLHGEEVSDQQRFAHYKLPPLKLLEDSRPFSHGEQNQQLRDRAVLLEKTFADFGLKVKVVGINTGPVITQFEIALETGLRVHKVTRLTDDIALKLGVPSVRMIAPIPGKTTVGIEIPNEKRADVRLKEVIQATSKKAAPFRLPLFLGKDTEGAPLVYDLADMPHLLIAGRTGTGKSVCLNALILSILMTRRPDEVKMILIDPKRTEMIEYERVPHLMHPVVVDPKKAEAILGWAVDKMEERYDLLSRARVRGITAYNDLKPGEAVRRIKPEDEEERRQIPERMPYIVIFIDEMADLMMQMKKEVEGHIIRLAQKSRAAGIHLVVATQRPTVDVITGLIKSNLPARICFKVVNKTDSRVVLDEMGADKLLGKGDLLFLPPGSSTLIRAQGAYASDEEILRVVGLLEGDPCYAPELMNLKTRDARGEGKPGEGGFNSHDDELYEPAVEIVLREGRGSVSLLQRALGIGYGRAARLIDYMAEDGIVGSYNGSNAREVLYTPEQWAERRGQRQESPP